MPKIVDDLLATTSPNFLFSLYNNIMTWNIINILLQGTDLYCCRAVRIVATALEMCSYKSTGHIMHFSFSNHDKLCVGLYNNNKQYNDTLLHH